MSARPGRQRLAGVVLTLALGVPSTAGAAEAVRPVQLGTAWAEDGNGTRQFFGVDGKGRVFRLDPDRLTVARVDRSGDLKGESELEALVGPAPAGKVVRGTMGDDGDDWLLLGLGEGKAVRFFAGGKERVMPDPGRWVRSSAVVGSIPLLAVSPFRLGQSLMSERDWSEAPLVVALDGGAWKPLVREGRSAEEMLEMIRHPEGCAICAQYEVHLAAEGGRGFWVVHSHYYHARRFDLSGRLLAEVTAGPQELRFEARNEERERLIERVARENSERAELVGRMMGKQVARQTVQAAAARDQELYLLLPARAAGTQRPALDRIDLRAGTVERVELAFDGYGGAVTLLPARDGLFVGPYEAAAGAWLIPWEVLLDAPWKPVEGAELQVHRAR